MMGKELSSGAVPIWCVVGLGLIPIMNNCWGFYIHMSKMSTIILKHLLDLSALLCLNIFVIVHCSDGWLGVNEM